MLGLSIKWFGGNNKKRCVARIATLCPMLTDSSDTIENNNT